MLERSLSSVQQVAGWDDVPQHLIEAILRNLHDTTHPAIRSRVALRLCCVCSRWRKLVTAIFFPCGPWGHAPRITHPLQLNTLCPRTAPAPGLLRGYIKRQLVGSRLMGRRLLLTFYQGGDPVADNGKFLLAARPRSMLQLPARGTPAAAWTLHMDRAAVGPAVAVLPVQLLCTRYRVVAVPPARAAAAAASGCWRLGSAASSGPAQQHGGSSSTTRSSSRGAVSSQLTLEYQLRMRGMALPRSMVVNLAPLAADRQAWLCPPAEPSAANTAQALLSSACSSSSSSSSSSPTPDSTVWPARGADDCTPCSWPTALGRLPAVTRLAAPAPEKHSSDCPLCRSSSSRDGRTLCRSCSAHSSYSSTEGPAPCELMGSRPGPLLLSNRQPHWHHGLRCWCLNFRGRVKLASVKNFQLELVATPAAPTPQQQQQQWRVDEYDDAGSMQSEDAEEQHAALEAGDAGQPPAAAAAAGQHQGQAGEVTAPAPPVSRRPMVLQFGKVEEHLFILDYDPRRLTALEAFGIALTSFDAKLLM